MPRRDGRVGAPRVLGEQVVEFCEGFGEWFLGNNVVVLVLVLVVFGT